MMGFSSGQSQGNPLLLILRRENGPATVHLSFRVGSAQVLLERGALCSAPRDLRIMQSVRRGPGKHGMRQCRDRYIQRHTAVVQRTMSLALIPHDGGPLGGDHLLHAGAELVGTLSVGHPTDRKSTRL